MYLALNNLQRLICHKTQQTKPNRFPTCGEFDPHWVINTLGHDDKSKLLLGTLGTMVIVVRNGKPRSHPGRGCWPFSSSYHSRKRHLQQ